MSTFRTFNLVGDEVATGVFVQPGDTIQGDTIQLIGRQARLFCVGVLWLGAGLAVYMIARPPMESLPHVVRVAWKLPAPIRALLGPAPTLIHVLAFSLMTGSLVGGSRRRLLLVCAVWAMIEIALEWLQSPALSHWLLQRPLSSLYSPYLRAYLERGTFDVADIFAALLGAAFAARSLTRHRR